MALAQYTKVEGKYWKTGQSGQVSLVFNINGEEVNLEHTRADFEQSMKPLLMTNLSVEELGPAIRQNFDENVVELAFAFAFTLKIFAKYTSFFSIGGFIDQLTSFKGQITIQADVPQQTGMGSSASYFAAIILNIYVDSSH